MEKTGIELVLVVELEGEWQWLWPERGQGLESASPLHDAVCRRPYREVGTLIFEDEQAIDRFISSTGECLPVLNSYVRMLRSLPNQSFVMTIREFADEANATRPKLWFTKDPAARVRKVIKRGQGWGDSIDFSFRSENDEEAAKEIYDFLAGKVEPEKAFRSLSFLRWRSDVRSCRNASITREGLLEPALVAGGDAQQFAKRLGPAVDGYFLDQKGELQRRKMQRIPARHAERFRETSLDVRDAFVPVDPPSQWAKETVKSKNQVQRHLPLDIQSAQ